MFDGCGFLRGARCVFAVATLLVGWLIGGAAAAEKPVSYSRDIRPLFASRCFTCHGPDASKRKAGLRLDVRDEAVREVIVPGDPLESVLLERIASQNPAGRMPPPASKKPPLTPTEIALVRRWIEEGAKYEPHWAYVKPVRASPPEVKNGEWAHGPIDRFLAAGHEEHGLSAAPPADPRTLVRRLSQDLLGLPPSPAEVDAFVADPSPQAYEKLVDRLLGSPHYGERMAVTWLDVVRYADSGGYHSDNDRNVWMYRDYVIKAFNDNKPFDRFTIEQLAGDLLPQAGQEEKVASGYNRLLQTTEEGGAQAKEYTAKYDADRVRNTAFAWMGSTMGCAQCHDHKYDPFTTKHFYSFAAFFADVKENAIARQEETPMPTAQQQSQLKRMDEQISTLEKEIETSTPALDGAQAEWEKAAAAHLAEQKPALPKEVAEALAIAREKRTDPQLQLLAKHYRSIAPALGPARDRLAALKQQRDQLVQQIPRTLITAAVEPRVVRILPRGNWQDDSGEVVSPAIPEFLGKVDLGGRRANRLDLAHWLVAKENPLVARVFVNRLWRLFFGQAIVRTPDDFGTQGALPTHPELLDWLATEFVDSGWDVKHMVKLMVMSRAYRQSSNVPESQRGLDPANLWLARQGEFRLEAEFVRDHALAISGLLALQIGGPSVKPYQPAGYWSYLNFPTRDWTPDRGQNQYRRGLYTWWQRTFLHPSLLAFDASTREECTVERPRSNTPLQALVLLNDPSYVEAARAFAVRMIREGGPSETQRLTFAFRAALGRMPKAEEIALLTELSRKHLKQYSADEAAARQFLAVGDAKAPEDIAAAELSAWTSVARVILNLHETITRY